MAEGSGEMEPLYKGSIFPVTIEETLNNTLIVCLQYGAKCYRGALMDMDQGNLPYGVDFSRSVLSQHWQSKEKEGTTVLKPSACNGKNELSALCYRHTYTLDSKAVNPKLLPPPRRDISKPLRDKNIRNMRLRPRQVLCAKCKQGVHETVTQNTTTTIQNHTQEEPKVEKHEKSEPVQDRYDTRKRKPVVELTELPKRSRKVDNNPMFSKSPVIKISFTNPQGRDTVMEIPPKPNLPNPSDSEELKDSPKPDLDTNNIGHDHYKKFKKALKRAKLKDKSQGDASSDAASCSNSATGSHKRSKKTKHKRKHRHRGLDSPKTENAESNDENEHLKENTAELENTKVSREVFPVGNPISNFSCLESMTGIEKCTIRNDDETTASVIVLSPRRDNPVAPSPNAKSRSEYDSDGSHTLVIYDEDGGDLFPPESMDGSENELEGSDNSIGGTSPPFNAEDQENCEDLNGDDRAQSLRPLMMKIQTKGVSKVLLDDGRTFRIGDIVWGKIHGFPWWPGRIISLTESLKDSGIIITQTAHISWFASSTMSHMPCQELHPFLEDFKVRYNKRKKGSYKQAVKQATLAAQSHANMEMKDMELDFLDE